MATPNMFGYNSSQVNSNIFGYNVANSGFVTVNTTQDIIGAKTFENTNNVYFGSGANLTGITALPPSNMVTTDTTQTITAAKTFENTSNVYFGIGANLTGITALPPSNMVTTDTTQTITAAKTITAVLTADQFKATGTALSTFVRDIVVGNDMVVGHGNNNLSSNVCFGANALLNNSLTATQQVAIGSNCLKTHNGTSGINVAIGANALQFGANPYGNVAIGVNALTKCESYGNIAIGLEVLRNCTSGNTNFGAGGGCLFSMVSGSFNVAVGTDCINKSTSGNYQVGIGNAALYNSNCGTSVGIGYRAGLNNLSGNSSTFIGDRADCAVAGNFSNSTAIGAFANVTASNQIVLGTAAETQVVQGQFNWNFGAIITASVTLSTPLKTMYIITSVAATIITLPNPVALHTGVRLLFKRKTNTQLINITTVAGSAAIYAYNGVVGVVSVSITASQYQSEMFCDGTNWFQINTM